MGNLKEDKNLLDDELRYCQRLSEFVSPRHADVNSSQDKKRKREASKQLKAAIKKWLHLYLW